MVSIPSCTTPIFSKIPANSNETQPAILVICHTSGNAVATWLALISPCAHRLRPITVVLTSNSAFIPCKVNMKRLVMRMCRDMAP